MKKMMLQTILLCCLCMASCSDIEENRPVLPPGQEQEEPETPDRPQDYTKLISKTNPVPAVYEQEAQQRGQVVRIDYDTRDYAEGTGAARTNTAYIYLPYGYDENTDQRYNVLYFVHGHYGTASTTFEAENDLLRKLLDHMTANRDMAPTIVVSPSYNYGEPTPNYIDADPYCEALPQELVNDLIPIVESRYRTYAESTDAAGLEASREHRAIGGFSMGAVTTWYALEHTLACFKYFMPISADSWALGAFAGMNRPMETAEYLAGIIRQSPYAGTGFYIWAASGTNDSAYRETLVQIEAMAQLTDVFPLSNLTFHEKDGARHEFRPMAEYLYNALPFFFPNGQDGNMNTYGHLTTSNTVKDVVEHEAFVGFGQFILPAERRYDDDMPLANVASLLPYHNYVTGERAVETINTMIDYVNKGNRLFYDIYSETDKQADSRKDNTGLFFFRGEPGRPFAIVCPGGGFSYVGAIHEGFPLAIALSEMGYNAFSIQYRTGGAQLACEDLAQAIDFIMRNAEELQVSTEDYSLWGGSAGARMAAYLGSYSTQGFINATHERPVAVIMGYTGHSEYTQNDPPTYVIIGEDDAIASPATMRRRVENLQALGIDAEFHLLPDLRHGFGLGIGTTAEGWEKDAVRFWEKYISRKN
mgnify:FL=1